MDFKADNIQVGSITKALSENIDGELIFRDASLPQGITLSNLVSDATYAEQIQNNVTAQVTDEMDVAVQELTAYTQNTIDVNTALVIGLSGELYDGTYETYLTEQGLLDGVAVLARENVFTENIGINVTPESQLHIKNATNLEPTQIILENTFEGNLFESHIEQFSSNLNIIGPNGGEIRLYTESDTTGEVRLGITDSTTEVRNTLKFTSVERVGQEQVFTTGESSVVTTTNDAFQYIREGAWINIGGDIRIVETKTSDNEIEVIGRYGTDTVSVSGGASFSYKNPQLELDALTITPYNDIGIGTNLPLSKFHIKGEDTVYLEDNNPKIHFTNKSGTYGMVSYQFTTGSFATSGYSLDLTSKKANEGATIKVNAVADNASLSTTSSGEIQFLTSPYTYETTAPEEVRATINTYGSFGINEDSPVARLHIKQEEILLTGTVAINSGSNIIQGSIINDVDEHVVEFDKQLYVGDTVKFLGETAKVTSISGSNLIIDTPFTNTGVNERLTAQPTVMLIDNTAGNIFRLDYEGNLTTKSVDANILNISGGNATFDDIFANNGLFDGNVRIKGNIVVEGESYEYTQSYIADPVTVVGYVSGGPSISGALNQLNGLEVYRGAIDPYRIVFDEADDYFKIGELGDEQIVATREASFDPDEIVIYDATEDRFIGSGFTPTSLLESRRHTEVIGNAVDYSYTVTHNLGTKDVHVTIRDNVTDEMILTDVIANTINTVMLHFASPPPSNRYTVKVIS